jgi:hypothetical protein
MGRQSSRRKGGRHMQELVFCLLFAAHFASVSALIIISLGACALFVLLHSLLVLLHVIPLVHV